MKTLIGFLLFSLSINSFAQIYNYSEEEALIKKNEFKCREDYIEMLPLNGDTVKKYIGWNAFMAIRSDYKAISCMSWLYSPDHRFSILDQVKRFNNYSIMYDFLSGLDSKTRAEAIKNLNLKRGNYDEIQDKIALSVQKINWWRHMGGTADDVISSWPRGYSEVSKKALIDAIVARSSNVSLSDVKKFASLLPRHTHLLMMEAFKNGKTDQAILWLLEYDDRYYNEPLDKEDLKLKLYRSNVNLKEHPALANKLIGLGFKQDEIALLTREVEQPKTEAPKVEEKKVEVPKPIETPKVEEAKSISIDHLNWKGQKIAIDQRKASQEQFDLIGKLNNTTTDEEKTKALITALLNREYKQRGSKSETKEQIQSSLTDFSENYPTSLAKRLESAKKQMDEQLKDSPKSYNRDYTAVSDIFTYKKMQCSSGTDYLLMHALYNFDNQKSTQTAVVILRPQHVLAGTIDSQTSTIVNGIESTAEGEGKLTIKSINGQWPADTRVVLTDDYWMTRLLENAFTDKKEVLEQTLKNSEDQLKIKQGKITEVESNGSSYQAQSFGDQLNSTSLGFGSVYVPSGDQERPQMDTVPQSLDAGALIEAGKARSSTKTESPFDRFAGANKAPEGAIAMPDTKFQRPHYAEDYPYYERLQYEIQSVTARCSYYLEFNNFSLDELPLSLRNLPRPVRQLLKNPKMIQIKSVRILDKTDLKFHNRFSVTEQTIFSSESSYDCITAKPVLQLSTHSMCRDPSDRRILEIQFHSGYTLEIDFDQKRSNWFETTDAQPT